LFTLKENKYLGAVCCNNVGSKTNSRFSNILLPEVESYNINKIFTNKLQQTGAFGAPCLISRQCFKSIGDSFPVFVSQDLAIALKI
jgi:hypothetical protein